MTMHARKTAELFYEKIGYAPHGDEFIEVTLPHIEMRNETYLGFSDMLSENDSCPV